MLGLEPGISRGGNQLNFSAVRGLADPRVEPEDDDGEKILPSRMLF
jgi:hypothetical protein